MFVARNVWKQFGRTVALRGVSLELKGQGVHFLLGPNGSGKTTLLKLFAGFLRPSRGYVRVFGLDPWRHEVVREKVCFYFEDVRLPLWLTGRDVLRFVCDVSGCDWDLMKQIAEELGVTGFWDRRVYSYSSGMYKKLALASILGRRCEAYVLDEPLTNLDTTSALRVAKLVEKFAQRKPVVITSHIPFDVDASLVRGIHVIVNGQLIYSGRGLTVYECSMEVLKRIEALLKQSPNIKVVINHNSIRIYGAEELSMELQRLCKQVLDVFYVYQTILTKA